MLQRERRLWQIKTTLQQMSGFGPRVLAVFLFKHLPLDELIYFFSLAI